MGQQGLRLFLELKKQGVEVDLFTVVTPQEGGEVEKYRKALEEHDLIHDFTHLKYAYLEAEKKPFPLVGTVWPTQLVDTKTPPPVKHPCLVGVSQTHSQRLSLRWGVPIRTVPPMVTPVTLVTPLDSVETESKPASDSEPKPESEPSPLPTAPPSPDPREGPLVYFGRLLPQKGAHLAVDVARRLRLPLELVGEDVLIPDQTYLVRLLRTVETGFHGRVTDDRKLRIVAGARCALFPYLEDSLALSCLTLLEALSVGTPVVAFDRGAAREYVMDGVNGFLVQNDEQMVEAVQNIEKIRREECQKSVENVLPERIAERYLKLYAEVLEGGGW